MTTIPTRPAAQVQIAEIAQENGWTVLTVVENATTTSGMTYTCVSYMRGQQNGVIIWVDEGRAANNIAVDGKTFKGPLGLINFRKVLEAA